MTDYLDFFTHRTAQMVEKLGRLVLFESPTGSKEHVDKLGEHVAWECRHLGAEMTVFPREQVGDVRLAVWNGDAPGKPIMLLAHLDTVWAVGTLDEMPLRQEDDILYGPGVVDMKAGIVIALEAIRGLVDRGELPHRPIWLFFNSDEETGSIHTRDLIHEKAAETGLVLVMEPGTEAEAVKTWRKGFARYDIHITGRAAHSGNAPEAGINAVIEAAHQALRLHDLNDLKNGTSVSVTGLHGGIAINIIPPEATLRTDVRFLKMAEAERVDQAIQHLTPVLPGAQITITGGIDRGPMAYDEQMARVFRQAREIAASIGLELHQDGSGGGSDGNFTAAMGIPTLDGLGGAGIGLHAAHEQVFIRSLPRRAALLAKILTDWDMDAV
jgi:glutamate carboxypeptidase